MDSVQFELDINHGTYTPKNDSNVEMYILGNFLTSDVGSRDALFFKRWALADKENPNSEFSYNIGGNITQLEEDGDGAIHLVDSIGSDDDEYYIPGHLKMTRQQFVQLLDDWQEKVCKVKPRKVIIRHENDQFIIETSN